MEDGATKRVGGLGLGGIACGLNRPSGETLDKSPEIARALDDLNCTVGSIEANLGILEDRLRPVLSGSYPEPAISSKEAETEMANFILRITERARYCSNKVSDLINRTEV